MVLDLPIQASKSYTKEIVKPFNKKVAMFEHGDSIDILPLGIDKEKALAEVIRRIKREELMAVGDLSYDIPKFRETGLSLIIGYKIVCLEGARKFQPIREDLNFVEDLK